MKKHIILSILSLTFVFFSCGKYKTPPVYTEQTVFLYMPWSDLYGYFKKNIEDIESALMMKESESTRFVCFLASSQTEATLFEMRYFRKNFIKTELKKYNVGTFTTSDGIRSIIDTVKYHAPSSKYSMIISSHGQGWLPTTAGKPKKLILNKNNTETYWQTRYFGCSNSNFQINIPTFVDAIKQSNTFFEYILFDACYMSNIEVAYDLKDVADYLIASPNEIMGYGFPYALMGEYLLDDVNYEAIVDEYYNFYLRYAKPCGTIAVTDLSLVDGMADIMKEINQSFDTSEIQNNKIQSMDGYNSTIYYDMGDYLDNLCDNSIIATKANEYLKKLIPYSAHTKTFFVGGFVQKEININKYSGITISDNSTSKYAAKKNETDWYKATH